jgi:hypothetical protein
MYHFSFELESAVVPATLKIEVSYAATYEASTYDHDSIFDVSDEKYEVYLENINITDSIGNSNFSKQLQDEIEKYVDREISNHFFNL